MLSGDSEDKMGCDLCLNLWYDLKRILLQDGLNPRVRCAFGNVSFNSWNTLSWNVACLVRENGTAFWWKSERIRAALDINITSWSKHYFSWTHTGSLDLCSGWIYSFVNLNYKCCTFFVPSSPFVDISIASHWHSNIFMSPGKPDKRLYLN